MQTGLKFERFTLKFKPIHKHSNLNAQRTLFLSIIKTARLRLFEGMEDVSCVNDREHKRTVSVNFTSCGVCFKLFTLRKVSPICS